MRQSIRKGPGGCGNQNVFYFECERVLSWERK